MKYSIEFKVKVVEEYLNNGQKLRETANRLNIPHSTLYQWIKLYKNSKNNGLLINYRRPWNRFDKDKEELIMLLKERNPSLTIREAQKILNQKGIEVSIKGIWSVWVRFGFCGYYRKKNKGESENSLPLTVKEKNIIKVAELKIKKGEIKEAARLLNSLPLCPQGEILNQIPDRYLNLKRKLDKLPNLFGKIPYPRFRKIAQELRKKLIERGLFYSSIRAAITELFALEWMGDINAEISLIQEIKKIFPKRIDPYTRYTIYILEGIARARLLDIPQSLACAAKARKILYSMADNSLYKDLCALYSFLGLWNKIKELLKEQDRIKLLPYGLLLSCYINAGEYKVAKHIFNLVKDKMRTYEILFYRAWFFYSQGKIIEARENAKMALKEAKGSGIINHIHSASLILAVTHMCLGEKQKAKLLIKKVIPILKKYQMKKNLFLREIILGKDEIPPPVPSLQVAYLLQQADKLKKISYYRKAFKLASQKGITGTFHCLIPFFPDAVNSLLEKGKKTYIPKALLKLPLFNEASPVYYIKFLGPLFIYKDQKQLRIKLSHKDGAFLIHLALKLAERGRFIQLQELYKNFWPGGKSASRNFSHLLVRLKKALKMPAHLFEIYRKYGNPILINQGVYFTTDYQEFEQTLAEAKALERAGEWSFARREYLRAFKFFRGEPFKKNFDEWSLNIRFRILSQFETEAINFAKSCIEHKNKKDAYKILKKVLKIIPDSKEATELVKRLNSVMVKY